MNEKKVLKYINENKEKELIETESITVSFLIPGKPENYVRERSGRGKHFYNPKEAKMQECKKKCLHQLSEKDRSFIKDVISTNDEYTVSINAKYFYPIQKNETIKNAALKELGLIKPIIRIDLDNYDKFILDALHDVLYDDDKHVTEITSEKKYSMDPRTEIVATITSIKIKKE